MLNEMKSNHIALACIMLCIVSCSGPRVVQIAPGTYMVTKTDAAGAFASISKLKADCIDKANEFAASKGKVAVAVSDDVHKPGMGLPSYEYQFKLVDPGAPAEAAILPNSP